MRTKGRLYKGIALVLSASLVSGLAATLPGVATKAHAASSTEAPSVQVYADRDMLMDDTFDPGSDDPAVAKLKLGKQTIDSKEKAIEWYILGRDKGITGDNIAIFAAENIGDALIFYKDEQFHPYSGDDETQRYVKGERAKDDSIAPNHYGESDIRVVLRKMAGEESDSGDTKYDKYFTSAEKALLQKTKVLTKEWNNEDMLYTTSDKLYLPSGKETFDDAVIYIGNVEESDTYPNAEYEYKSKALPWDPYLKSDKWLSDGIYFWLRSTSQDLNYCVNYVSRNENFVSNSAVYSDGLQTAIRPASNLNLANVLFASAADSSEGEGTYVIDMDTDDVPAVAMTLRLNGAGDLAKEKLEGDIGQAELIGDKLNITRGSTERTVTLIIQAKDSGEDWCYVKTISADTTVTAADIEGHDSADLSKCKIWLEATGKDEMIYAVEGAEHKHTYGSDNVCTVCGYILGEHRVTKVDEQSPTRTSVGYKEHFECSHCDMWFIYPATLGLLIDRPKSYFEIPVTRGTTYSDGSTRNSDRYKTDSGSSYSRAGSGSTSKVTGASWSQDANGRWWYYNGNTKVIGWVYDRSDGKWYYCDAEKGRLYGWFYDTVDGYWYYLDANTGAMLTGWQLIGGKQYYFASAPQTATYTYDTASAKWVYSNAANLRPYGSMYAGTVTPDNHSVDADGARVS